MVVFWSTMVHGTASRRSSYLQLSDWRNAYGSLGAELYYVSSKHALLLFVLFSPQRNLPASYLPVPDVQDFEHLYQTTPVLCPSSVASLVCLKRSS